MLVWALCAGCFASLGAVGTKITFGQFSLDQQPVHFLISLSACALAGVLMWWCHTRALALADSTLRAVVINTGANFALTAILGYVIFEETHSSLFWCGPPLIVAGLALIASEETRSPPKEFSPPPPPLPTTNSPPSSARQHSVPRHPSRQLSGADDPTRKVI